MAAHHYGEHVIGSIVDLPFTVRDRADRQLVPLEDEDAAATCKIIDSVGTTILEAGACTFSSTQGRYRWATTGMQAGTYRVRFSISAGLDPVPNIQPAEWAEIKLVT